MSKLSKNMDLVLHQGPDLIDFYRENPCIAAYELLGVDLAPVQRIVFESMWFKPYNLVVVGRGGGKSVYVREMASFFNTGLVYLNEILPPIPDFLDEGEDVVIDYDARIYTSEGFRKTKKLCLEKEIEGKKLITQLGLIKRGSNHHPLLTIDVDGNFVYKQLDEFEIGDKVCIQRGQQVFGTNDISIDDAYMIGLLTGDGSISNRNTITITSEDTFILDFCENYCKRNNVYYKTTLDRRTKYTYSIRFSNTFNTFLDKHNVPKTLSYYKSVPYSIRTANKEAQIAFLQGYFDTDGTAEKTKGKVSCCSVSKKLIIEVQAILLNFGIVSRIRKKKTKSNFGKAYLLDMTSDDAYKFKELIGFRLKRKQNIVDAYFNTKKLNSNKNNIPFILQICHDITKYYHKTYTTSKKPSFRIRIGNKKELSYERLHKFLIQCNNIEKKGYSLKEIDSKILLLKDIIKYNYFFDTVVSTEDWKGDCYDFEMDMESDIEPNYITNSFVNHNTFLSGLLATLLGLLYPGYRIGLIGPSFRQSKMIFSEVEKIYSKSSILREATEKRPIRGSDTCYLKFKSVGGHNNALIEALPIGADGAKIRGSRFYCVLVDEFAQVPQKIIETVLAPMSITKLDPMKKVRELERRLSLIESGLATEADFEEDSVNKMIGTSSGYYKFNHMYKRMREYWNQIEEGSEDHAVFQIPYTLLPEGFLDPKNVENSRRVMSSHEFNMEYMAAMVSDSEGFFKASLLELCTTGSNFDIELVGDKTAKYVIGIDPNQGGKAKCGVVVVKLGKPNKLVRVMALDGKTTQDITVALQELCVAYNVIRVYMDRGGGGKAVSDLLEEGYNETEPIIDRGNKDKFKLKGRHILELTTFSTSWIADANFSTLALFEDRHLLFPSNLVSTTSELIQDGYELIETLKKQCLNIVVSQTASGILHFDTPKKGQNKDLYSALILAGYGVKALEHELEEEEESILYGSSGLIRGKGNTNWRVSQGVSGGVLTSASAIPTKRI